MTLLVRGSLIAMIALLLSACAKPQHIVTKTEYIEVKVPVVYKIDRPDRPRYLKTDTVPTYLNKLVRYTHKLEIIIDEHNTSAKGE